MLGSYDVLDDGAIRQGLAFSRRPLQSIDDRGNVIVWTDASLPGGPTTDASGAISVAWSSLPTVPLCLDLYFQWWIADSVATFGASASNGLRGLTP